MSSSAPWWGTGFGRLSQDRFSRAKTKTGKDAGRVNGSAIRLTEDAAKRTFAAVRACSESVDWAQAAVRVPDAPVSNFTLSLDGGNKSLLENPTNLCKAPQMVLAQINAQNGATENQNEVLGARCGKLPKRKRHLSHAKSVR
jgi:hypothetical protein